MNALDFFVNFVRTGNICGLGLDTTPQQWADALGDRCISAVDKKQKQSDIATEPDRMRPGELWSMYLTVDADIWAEPTRKTR